MDNIINRLRENKKLLDEGFISQEEFEKNKEELLKLNDINKEQIINNTNKNYSKNIANNITSQNNISEKELDKSLIFDIVLSVCFIMIISFLSWS